MNADGKQPHILVINHTPEILALIRELLEDEGFQVSTQSHADKDLDRIGELSPNVIILDYMWSTVDEDWSFLQLLRLDRRTARMPVILCTGAVREVHDLEEHLHTMDVAVVFKPFDIDQLVQAVTDALQRKTLPGRMLDLDA
jgi:two-component system, OmpR family, response regulator VicR